MAVENTEKKYYKINFNRCKVEGYNVFVDYYIYNNQEERQKEKTREPLFRQFFERLQNKIILLNDSLPNLETETEITDPVLLEQLELVSSLSYIAQYLQSCFYKINGEDAVELPLEPNIINEMTKLGYQQEWVDDPICYSGGGCLNCGEYKDEVITYSFYYDRLKNMIDDPNLLDV